MALLRVCRRSRSYAALALGLSTFPGACPGYQTKIAPAPDVRVDLVRYGLAPDYARHDADDDCTDHVIGYRSVVWLSSDRLAVVFNTSPNCRPSSGQRVTSGSARLLVFDPKGNLQAKRDVLYDADGGEELVASGEALHGPGQTLLFRVEEAGDSKSGVRLFDAKLNDVARIDRFMETLSVIDRSLVFQEGVVHSGPRTYDVYDGGPSLQMRKIIQNWPIGTMDRTVGSRGVAYMLCEQGLGPNDYRASNVIYANTHRRCWMKAQSVDGRGWEAQLKPDQVASLLGVRHDGSVVGIVRGTNAPDQLVIWRQNQAPEILPWFPEGYGTELQDAAGTMDRYQGIGGKDCNSNATCSDDEGGRLMIFDRSSRVPLADRRFPDSARAALSPDGSHYATFEAGELRIYSLPQRTP